MPDRAKNEQTLHTVMLVANNTIRAMSSWKTLLDAKKHMLFAVESGSSPKDWKDNFVSINGVTAFISQAKISTTDSYDWVMVIGSSNKFYNERTDIEHFNGTVAEAFARRSMIRYSERGDRVDPMPCSVVLKTDFTSVESLNRPYNYM